MQGRIRTRVLLRSLVIQASWNYRTLLGTGFAFALLPVLRTLYGSDPDRLRAAIERHRGLFNSHPYFTPMALGAVAVMEAEGEDPATIERFKSAIRGSLGTLGDRLVWAGWRPVCLLLCLAVLLLGLPWWLGVFGFLLVYNTGHVALRWWSHRVGWQEGRRVAERFRASRLAGAQRVLSLAGTFLVGLTLPLAATGGFVGTAISPFWVGLAAIAAVIGMRFGSSVRTPAILGLGVLLILGTFSGTLS